MRQMIDTAKIVVDKAKEYAYHKGHKDTARKYRRSIEFEQGKLDLENIKLCNEYANDVFGDEKYAPWLITYCTYAKEFKEGWIPDNYYGKIVVRNYNGVYGKISNRNAVINTLLNETDSLDICYYINHLLLSTSSEILNEKKLKTLLFKKSKKVVFKLEDSRQGKGVYFFNEKTFNIQDIKKLGNGVFQNYIEQHPFFMDFTKSSVATIRITSICDDNGNIDIRAGYFRFGRENDTHVMSDSAMKIAIDIKNGTLCEDAYFPNWTSTKQLPGNDILFAGKVLPSYNECVAEVKKLHKCIPFIRCVGWDIIVDNNNKVKLIELNGGHNSITFNETVQGPCFKGLGWENLTEVN